MTDRTNTPIVKPSDIARIHWKVQATVHFVLSLPIAFLTVFSWGLQLPALLRIVIAYLSIYLLIFFPLYRLLPHLTLLPVHTLVKKLNNGGQLTDDELKHLISYLINYPLPTAIITAFIEITAFIIGALTWKTGIIVPELLDMLGLALFETIMLGFVVAINISFLNLVRLENYSGLVVEKIISLHPKALELNIPIRHISMYTKVLFLILLTTIAGEISIFIFFTTYILSNNPEKFFQHASFVIAVVLINVLYIFILAPIVAKNFTSPLKKLVTWIKDVTQGDMASRIRFITNDETGEIIHGSNMMISRLDKTANELTTSLKTLENKQVVIESEKNKLSTVLFGVIDGVIALNKDKRIILVNKAGEEITGLKESEVINKSIDEIFILKEETGLIISSENYCRESAEQVSVSFTNLKLQTNDGKEKYINLTCSTIGGNINTETEYIITFHDMTEERQLAEMKLDFVSMAAHELRTPTTIIKGYMQTFLQEYGNKLDTDQNMMLNRVFYSAQELSSLINSLLTVSKIERKAFSLEREPLDWKSVVKNLVADLNYLALEKNIKLTCTIPETFATSLEADKIRISEVFGNLISNAINYTPVGGSVDISVEETRDEITTHIKDTGVGIPGEALPHLFTKFFRVSGTLEQGSKGTGLGLYLAKAIVEMHGGKIWVLSKINEGSTFSFSLPKKAALTAQDKK